MKKILILLRDERPKTFNQPISYYQTAIGYSFRKYKVGQMFIKRVKLNDLLGNECEEKVVMKVENIIGNCVLVYIPSWEIR